MKTKRLLYLILKKGGVPCGTLNVSDYTEQGLKRVQELYTKRGYQWEVLGGTV